MIRAYVYLKDGEVYAYTENKKIDEQFKLTRRMDKFKRKKMEFDEESWKGFMWIHQQQMMLENVLTDGKSSFTFVTTYQEDYEIGLYCERIYDDLLDIRKKMLKVPWDFKMRKILSVFITAINEKEDKKFGKFDTFKIFIKLFGDTVL